MNLRKTIKTGLGLLVMCAIFIASLTACAKSTAGTGAAAKKASVGSDIVITKSDISDKAKFIAYRAGEVDMEVITVKASDGTIRTAFNTCQVCFDSGRGYYKQQGNELVCQNCGNRFKIDKVEKQKNGCNPVPIFDGNKKDDGTSITIPADFLEKSKDLFSNWKTR